MLYFNVLVNDLFIESPVDIRPLNFSNQTTVPSNNTNKPNNKAVISVGEYSPLTAINITNVKNE
ncbi:Hypothetical protein MCYN_0338 [Mycoplasmopsis cynos C142]|uniref:Uncharacterized protein n=1 Tax=Mycoplasmopsis cynos (strain C142) TaxID=1246955 RepID=L0RX23_MYCC1|nr:Hypothetical protein MCYN_0338 [Mycoplasmopsis cynos C142]